MLALPLSVSTHHTHPRSQVPPLFECKSIDHKELISPEAVPGVDRRCDAETGRRSDGTTELGNPDLCLIMTT